MLGIYAWLKTTTYCSSSRWLGRCIVRAWRPEERRAAGRKRPNFWHRRGFLWNNCGTNSNRRRTQWIIWSQSFFHWSQRSEHQQQERQKVGTRGTHYTALWIRSFLLQLNRSGKSYGFNWSDLDPYFNTAVPNHFFYQCPVGIRLTDICLKKPTLFNKA